METKLKEITDSVLIRELEKRGFEVCCKPNFVKNKERIIRTEELEGYHFVGETKYYSKEEFIDAVKMHVGIPDDEVVDICKDYFKLEMEIKSPDGHIIQEERLIPCDKNTEKAIEMWGWVE